MKKYVINISEDDMQLGDKEQGTLCPAPSLHSPSEGKGGVQRPPQSQSQRPAGAPGWGLPQTNSASLLSGRKKEVEETLGGNKVSISIMQPTLDPHYHG